MSGRQSEAHRIPIMQVTDSLIAGGAERVAVNLANVLPRDRYEVHLAVTRDEGPLAGEVAPDVGRILLHRRRRLPEPRALLSLAHYVREHGIRLLHCHKDTFFFASLAALWPPFPRLLWHDHYGSYAVRERPAWLYRLGTSRVQGVISVNRPLRDWALEKLSFPRERVWYVPNFVRVPRDDRRAEGLPGTDGYRIVCVCNVRPQKDLLNLVRAMKRVVVAEPRAHVLVVGEAFDTGYFATVEREVARLDLQRSVSFLGGREDVAAILRSCDLGVLSSASEGLPLALIEYGMAGLASVVTRVGQCADVLENGDLGSLVPPADPDALAEALVRLLGAPAARMATGERFRDHVRAHYSESAAVARICAIYDTLLEKSSALAPRSGCSSVGVR